MKTTIYLFNSRDNDKELEIDEINPAKLKENQLLWIDIAKRDKETIETIIDALKLKKVPLYSILNVAERPKVDIFEDFYRFFIVSVTVNKKGQLKRIPIDFLVGKNYVVTIHDDEVEYFKNYTQLHKGETHIGELDAESFIAALLDLHIVSYFGVLEEIEEKVDRLDAKVLETEVDTDEFLEEMVSMRKTVSHLRRWFLPHRDVFYALSRPDFQQVTQSDSDGHFRLLNEHFENATDAIESSRDTLLGLFDLYATKSAQTTNDLVKRLTFITLVVGSLGAVAGVWGMNFEVEYFKSAEFGFWLTIGGMAFIVVSLTAFAKYKRWI